MKWFSRVFVFVDLSNNYFIYRKWVCKVDWGINVREGNEEYYYRLLFWKFSCGDGKLEIDVELREECLDKLFKKLFWL